MLDNVRLLPEQEERVETGPVRFGDDWAGIFIRGDNAYYFAYMLEDISKIVDRCDFDDSHILVSIALKQLVQLLKQCNEGV